MELKPAEVQSWWKIITDFPGYWDSFNTNYQALLQQANYVYQYHPEMKAEVDKLVNDGSKLYAQLLSVKQAIDGINNTFSAAGTTVEGWLQSAGSFASDTYDTVKSWLGLSALGIVPIIWAGMAVGTAAGILIAVGNWLTSVQATATRLNRIRELEASGLTPKQASSQVDGELGPAEKESTFLGLPIKWLIVGAVLIVALPPFFNYLSSRKSRKRR